MHRQFSLQPFSRHYSHSTHPFLGFLEIEKTSSSSNTEVGPSIVVTPRERGQLMEILKTYKEVQANGTLHTLTFVTVNDYLWLLRAVSQELSALKRKAMYYLAAAVSDFFLPRQKLVSLLRFKRMWNLLIGSDSSQNTRYNPAKEVYTLRWIKYRRS
jgi:phosphopantothenate---cysteine ligase (ATP)